MILGLKYYVTLIVLPRWTSPQTCCPSLLSIDVHVNTSNGHTLAVSLRLLRAWLVCVALLQSPSVAVPCFPWCRDERASKLVAELLKDHTKNGTVDKPFCTFLRNSTRLVFRGNRNKECTDETCRAPPGAINGWAVTDRPLVTEACRTS